MITTNNFQAFSVVFQNAIAKAEPSDTVTGRVNNLTDCISFSVFKYTSRGLFECDKLIFASQMTFQVGTERKTCGRIVLVINLIFSIAVSFDSSRGSLERYKHKHLVELPPSPNITYYIRYISRCS